MNPRGEMLRDATKYKTMLKYIETHINMGKRTFKEARDDEKTYWNECWINGICAL